MNSETSFSTLSLQGIIACRMTSRVALQRTWKYNNKRNKTVCKLISMRFPFKSPFPCKFFQTINSRKAMMFGGELQFKQLQKRSLGKKIKASKGIEPMPPRYWLSSLTYWAAKPYVGRGAQFSGLFKLSQGRFGPKNIHVVNKIHVINGCHLFFFDARNDCNNSGLPQWVRQWRVGSITSVEQILRQKRKVSWRNHSSKLKQKKVQFPCKCWKYHANWNPEISIFKTNRNWFWYL